MGAYKESLTNAEWERWSKEVRKWLIDMDWTKEDLGEAIGYSGKTCTDALGNYDRCSKFFIAAVNERMRRRE